MNHYQLQKVSRIFKYGIEIECIRATRKVDNRFVGKWIKEKAIALGPTFIKIGQLMSTRKDIFGKEFTDELKDLQDNISPLPLTDLDVDLKGINGCFEFIEPFPIASASIGQVHKAKLKSGQDVVIKARRPGITDTIQYDFEIVTMLLNIAERLTDSRRLQEISILFKEYYSILQDEINFEKERKNMVKFNDMFKTTPWIKIPKVFEEASNANVITMEYVPSIKIDNNFEIDNLKFNKSRIADKLIETYIAQIIDHGTIHLDPHPGNVGISSNGKIVFYDFGMTLSLDERFRESFDDLLMAIYNKDVEMISKIAIDNEFILLDDGDTQPFQNFLSIFLKYIETLDVDNFKIEYLDVFDTSELNFMLSSKFVMLLRGITILEGVCKDLDPTFKYSRNLDAYINKIVFNIENLEKKIGSDMGKFIQAKNNSRKLSNSVTLTQNNKKINDLSTKVESNMNMNRVLAIFLFLEFILKL